MWVPSQGQEDPLEKEMATHTSILAWRIPRTEEPGGLQSMGSQRVGYHLATERVMGRKARGLQTEEIGCKCQTFLSLLSGRRKQTSNIFFPSLYKFKRRFLLKYCVAIKTSWFHLKLTIFKPWVNQCILLMEMFVLSYVNVLCICPRLCLQVSST